jgi:SAM-dependent methyltransferase
MNTSPAPEDARRIADEAAFANRFYASHASELTLNQTFFRKYAEPHADWDWREWGAKRLGSIRDCDVLDFGCGAGEETVYLAKMGARVTAIDISEVGVRLATDRARANGVADRVQAFVMRCDPTTFPDASFDVIHGFGILHHIGLESGLKEIHRLMRPGGRGLFFEHMGNSSLLERLRPKDDGHRTEDERPVRWKDVRDLSPMFARMETKAFHIISRLRTRVPVLGTPTFRQFDDLLLRAVPGLRHFASGIVIFVEK